MKVNMKAMEIFVNDEKTTTAAGGKYNSRLVEIERPTLSSYSSSQFMSGDGGPQMLLVKVVYSALDTGIDGMFDTPFIGGMFLHDNKTKPVILGWHYSGVVIEAIDGTTSDDNNFKVGDEIFGHLQYNSKQKQGSLSEYIVVDSNSCAKKPRTVPHDIAAAVTTESMTALQALRDIGKLGIIEGSSTKKNVMIFGGGGGVGSIAVSIAKHVLHASHVTAVCSTKDVERVKSLGADIVIDRKRVSDPLSVHNEDKGMLYDVIFVTTGYYSALKCSPRLAKYGTFVSPVPTLSLFAAQLVVLPLRFQGQSAGFVMCHSKKSDLEIIGKWLAMDTTDEKLHVAIDSMYKIKDLTKALQRQHDESTSTKTGRVVIQVADGW